MNEQALITTLSEVDALRLRCAMLELRLVEQQCKTMLDAAVRQYDILRAAVCNSYFNGRDLEGCQLDLDKGIMIFPVERVNHEDKEG